MTIRSLRWPIIAFCLWHMAAVGLYSLPSSAKDPLSGWLRAHAVPVVQPYVLWTSQWQQWNVFSPDPMRRVESYIATYEYDGITGVIPGLSPALSGPTRRSDVLSLLRRLSDNPRLHPVLERYLQTYCTELRLPPETLLTLQDTGYVLPADRQTPRSWQQWEAAWQPLHTIVTRCPA